MLRRQTSPEDPVEVMERREQLEAQLAAERARSKRWS